MYALNSYLRLFRFIANSLIGLVVGFCLGVVSQGGSVASVLRLFGI